MTGPAIVTGPGIEGKRAPSAAVGLSAATTYAARLALRGTGGTFYVRVDDDVYGYAEAHEDGSVTTHRNEGSKNAR